MMEDNDKYGVSYATSKNKIAVIKIEKRKKKLTFFYLTNPYHFANSNEVKHDNYLWGWKLEWAWTIDHGPWTIPRTRS